MAVRLNPDDLPALFGPAEQYADHLRRECGGTPTLDQLKRAFGETDNPYRDRPAFIEFRDGAPIEARQLAFTRPDPESDYTRHAVYVREALAAPNEATLLLHVLAHELCHVAFGKYVGEEDADQFGARLLGLDYVSFRDVICDYENRVDDDGEAA